MDEYNINKTKYCCLSAQSERKLMSTFLQDSGANCHGSSQS